MDAQSELGERPRATLIYRTVASFLSISRSTGGSVGPTERRTWKVDLSQLQTQDAWTEGAWRAVTLQCRGGNDFDPDRGPENRRFSAFQQSETSHLPRQALWAPPNRPAGALTKTTVEARISNPSARSEHEPPKTVASSSLCLGVELAANRRTFKSARKVDKDCPASVSPVHDSIFALSGRATNRWFFPACPACATRTVFDTRKELLTPPSVKTPRPNDTVVDASICGTRSSTCTTCSASVPTPC